jgi:hypothetical protein
MVERLVLNNLREKWKLKVLNCEIMFVSVFINLNTPHLLFGEVK